MMSVFFLVYEVLHRGVFVFCLWRLLVGDFSGLCFFIGCVVDSVVVFSLASLFLPVPPLQNSLPILFLTFPKFNVP